MFDLTFLAVAAFSFAFGLAMHLRKQKDARRIIALLERGQMCIACEGTDVQSDCTMLHCQTCGHVASLAAIQGAKISDYEIATLTDPTAPKR